MGDINKEIGLDATLAELAWEGRRLMMRRLVVEVRVARVKAMGKLERLGLWDGFILRMESMRSQKAAYLHEYENEMHGKTRFESI